jgi:Fe/S biogenesis protein NfuA
MSTDIDQTETTNAAGPDTDELVLTVADEARVKVLEVRDGEDDADSLALRVEITGVNGADWAYDLAFEPVSETQPGDWVHDDGELTVVVPAESVDRMRGATLDLPASGQGGLVIRNPNPPSSPAAVAAADLDLTGDAAQKIQQLLDASINPSLASHGGFASLVGVDGSTAYLSMGGGCQGCAMSQATMVQGIATAIESAIPEITEVVDATDHSAGENPFYT